MARQAEESLSHADLVAENAVLRRLAQEMVLNVEGVVEAAERVLRRAKDQLASRSAKED